MKQQGNSDKCKMACNDNCFTVLDSASTYHLLKIMEALHILWEQPILKEQAQHFDVSLSFKLPSFCLYNGCLYKLVVVSKPLCLYLQLRKDDESENCIAKSNKLLSFYASYLIILY